MEKFLIWFLTFFCINAFADTDSTMGGGDPAPDITDAIFRVPVGAAASTRSYTADPMQKYRFGLIINGVSEASFGFQKISGLTQEVDVIDYSEGGYTMGYSHKIPGKPKVSEVTCERGVFAGDSTTLGLFLKTVDATIGTDYRFNLTITHKNRFGVTIHTYTLKEAWVSKWEGTDFDASSGDVAIEKMTIQYEALEVTTGTTPSGS